MLKKPRAILFDWDNTLVDSWPGIHQALHCTFTEMGHDPWTLEDIRGNREGIHRSLRDSFPRIFGEKWQQAREIYFREFLKSHLKQISILPGAHETLEALTADHGDVFLGVVSNKTGPYLREEVGHIGWDRHFGKVVGAGDAREDKPSGAPVLLALEGSGVAPGEHVWLVGDSETDLEAALNAGIRPVFFGARDLPKEYHSDARVTSPIHHVRNHGELKEIIRRFTR